MELERLINNFKLFKNNFKNTEVFLFGSILSSERFEDIDVLLIYQDYEDLSILKKEIQDLLPYELIHFSCLTKKEELELNFIEKTKALKI
jgi:predicted nucleotidyltransferase